ncbi:WASH complex subunit strumpellin [Trypanosoma rangeli]|uniref:WASH complex subunit strumpellin n=1 Tax=Trypanosoma rangeli TaxID=5698 RepID=A0A422NCQ2_TRYRA|nr:WASH complex subunit strumpellin [Trypanosoma rangeli]RNF03089.1 WASH complex subunit strumpellin [Trypanosoma rangeli]|eukprot:RNF03089.1 WASH complex subunit strumpellin [Trypanosoma rangeli]
MNRARWKKHRSEFLNDDCGQNALQLVARGSTIIAEILRLSEHIPLEFIRPEETEYTALISDFRYFKAQDEFEQRIQNSIELLQKDEVFATTHMELLDRFFKLFRGVYGYVMELNRYIEEIREGMYISQTLESILVNLDGKQLLCEIMHLYGVMLLLLDHKLGGKTRENLLVSYIRYKGAGEANMVEVTNLCRATGYEPGHASPECYPVAYFSRVPIDKEVVGMILGRIRSDDIYQMAYNYPAPEHRSAALALQGAVLYVLLFFRPEILHQEGPVMREIVDKHFADNWVINYYMGFTVDLTLAWRDFKAASDAISRTIATENVAYHLERMRTGMTSLNSSIGEVLREGVLTEKYVLDNIHASLLPRIREANVVLRWFILHTTRGAPGSRCLEKYRRSCDMVAAAVTEDDIITLLLRTAQLEFTLRAMFTTLLKQKRSKWESSREEGAAKMLKLATFFSGEHVLSDNVRDSQLEAWFTEISERIQGLEYSDSITASRKIQKLIKALENVQEFHQIDSNLQVVQFVQDTRFLLRQMIRYINIENKVLITIATVGDLSYAWELVATYGCFVNAIQLKIKQQPDLAVQMRAVFVKLASMLELPCNRIDQGAQNDARLLAALETTSEYYSSELVAFARSVLHVIPTSIFDVLRQIMKILTDDLHECPTKLLRREMKSESQLDLRRKLSALTADIARYASGILAMESTLVGVIQVDSHQLLEDGIRKELVRQITHMLHHSLLFDRNNPISASLFDNELAGLAQKLNGIRASFEYIQDYVNVHGLRIWLEEFSRIVNFNVEMECNTFMQKKLYPWKSQYQSDSIPIPYFPRTKEKMAYSFLGRILQHLLMMTDPMRSVFLTAYGSWYERGSLQEIVGTRTFTSICNAIGSMGLGALDRLMCFVLAKDLQLALKFIRAALEPVEEVVAELSGELCPAAGTPENATHIYAKLVETVGGGSSGGHFAELTKILVRVGRIQLMRTMLASELRAFCKLNSGSLFAALSTANEALLMDLRHHYHNPGSHPIPDDVIAVISPFLDCVGISDALSKVYVTSRPIPSLVFHLLALTLCNVPKMRYDASVASMVPNLLSDLVDPEAFAQGLSLLLKQFHSDQLVLFLNHLSQAVRVYVCSFENKSARQKEDVLLTEAEVLTQVIHKLAASSGLPIIDFHRALPATLCGMPRLSTQGIKR